MTGEYFISSITLQLKSGVPEVTKRYKESQNQDIVRPCFLVKEITSGQDKLMFNRYRRNPRIRITYLPKDSSSVEEDCRAMGERLYEVFRILTLPNGRSIFGREMSYEIVDNELRFTVEFPVQVVWAEEEQPKMETLIPNENVKE